jgi:hypothetical protein
MLDRDRDYDQARMRNYRRTLIAHERWERDGIQQEEVLDLLQSIDDHRAQLVRDAETLREMLEFSDELYGDWRAFCAQGGVSAVDFQDFLKGRMPRRSAKLKRHLRVIASNERPRKRLRLSRSSGGPEAA